MMLKKVVLQNTHTHTHILLFFLRKVNTVKVTSVRRLESTVISCVSVCFFLYKYKTIYVQSIELDDLIDVHIVKRSS